MDKKSNTKFKKLKSTLCFIVQCVFVLAVIAFFIYAMVGRLATLCQDIGISATIILHIFFGVVIFLIVIHLGNIKR